MQASLFLLLSIAATFLQLCFCLPTATFPIGNSDDLFEGDIKLTEAQEKAVKKAIKRQESGITTFGLTNVYPAWKNGVVVYTFHSSIGQRQSSAINAAMKEWTTKTNGCITFKRRTTERNYVEFHVGSGCWGHLGQPNGKSQISVGRGCEQQHVMSHEIGHALGFWHEQSRPDRDEYLQILWNNVPTAYKEAFAKYGKDRIDSLGVPYDYTSIMHYPWNAFSTTGRNTLKALRQVPHPGPYVRISDLDVKQAKLFYKCSGVKPVITIPPLPLTQRPPTKRPPVTECVTVVVEEDEEETTGHGSCVDRNRLCSGWARRGECRRNPAYMKPNCCQSCGGSGGSGGGAGCIDNTYYCFSWAQRGECARNPRYMHRYCRKSCAVCSTTKKKKITKKCHTVTSLPTPPIPPKPETDVPPPKSELPPPPKPTTGLPPPEPKSELPTPPKPKSELPPPPKPATGLPPPEPKSELPTPPEPKSELPPPPKPATDLPPPHIGDATIY